MNVAANTYALYLFSMPLDLIHYLYEESVMYE